jgi:hypothetical protein
MFDLTTNQIVVLFVVYIVSAFSVIHAIAMREANGIDPKDAKTVVLYAVTVLPGVNTLFALLYWILKAADRGLSAAHRGM